MKTSELTRAALDWAVAKCEGGHIGVANNGVFFDAHDGDGFTSFEPSTDWMQGGPIIEREGFCIQPFSGGWECFVAHRLFEDDHHHSKGPTPLIAAMRCYVASKLGDDINIPEELL
jgi:hypothetical protein